MTDEPNIKNDDRLAGALAKIMALPSYPFGGPMCASDICDHDEDGPVDDDWGLEARELIAQCVNFVCEHGPELAALRQRLTLQFDELLAEQAKAEQAERERDEAVGKLRAAGIVFDVVVNAALAHDAQEPKE